MRAQDVKHCKFRDIVLLGEHRKHHGIAHFLNVHKVPVVLIEVAVALLDEFFASAFSHNRGEFPLQRYHPNAIFYK
ncbi:hypothetical protein HMPREF9134_00824 [Porphyromonas catoniae F0037]|uniref:Uncharacterized protein n=1 Tax=Porphyromonas catoniae F0037 TaxID=1127696 RepID=L1NE45_9PORP|nr:hypothetical protein HMPREF9134_00824 [Porphyromonas catoniae F0037]